jgi:hydroxymethylpyrimidine pyrophosphatase-like HAD family hydrolase
MSVIDNPRLPLPKARDVKLIILDIDGTLLDSRHELPETNLNYIVLRRLRDTFPDLHIILSTGKQYRTTELQRASLDLNVFHACHLNGSVLYAPGGKVLFSAWLEVPVMLSVYESMRERGCTLFLYDYDRVYQVLPDRAGDEGRWARRLRKLGEDLFDYEEAMAQSVLQDVKDGKIKVIKMAVREDETLLPGALMALSLSEAHILSIDSFTPSYRGPSRPGHARRRARLRAHATGHLLRRAHPRCARQGHAPPPPPRTPQRHCDGGNPDPSGERGRVRRRRERREYVRGRRGERRDGELDGRREERGEVGDGIK